MTVFILEINDKNIVAHEFELYIVYQNKNHWNIRCLSLPKMGYFFTKI